MIDAADRVILVTTAEPGALAQARRTLDYFEERWNPRVQAKVVLNRVGRDLDPTAVASTDGLPILCTISSDYRSLYDAVMEGELVSPKSRLGRDFIAAARAITGLRDTDSSRRPLVAPATEAIGGSL